MESEKLTPRHYDALREVESYTGRNRIYWWRVASMRDLAAVGYVEQYRPPSLERSKGRLPYRITPARRSALSTTTKGGGDE